jgi:DNA-directed RNA polymerase specialized sigma24 family protein
VKAEELAQAIRLEEQAAQQQGDCARGKTHRDQATDLKIQLWHEIRPRVRQLLTWIGTKFRRPLARAGLELDDLENELYPKFVRVAGRFDPARKCQFWTFLDRVLLHEIYSILRGVERDRERMAQFEREKRDAARRSPAAPAGQIVEHFHDLCDRLLKEGWPPNEMTAYRAYRIDCYTQQQIAQTLHRSVGWVNGAIAKLDEEIRRRW